MPINSGRPMPKGNRLSEERMCNGESLDCPRRRKSVEDQSRSRTKNDVRVHSKWYDR